MFKGTIIISFQTQLFSDLLRHMNFKQNHFHHNKLVHNIIQHFNQWSLELWNWRYYAQKENWDLRSIRWGQLAWMFGCMQQWYTLAMRRFLYPCSGHLWIYILLFSCTSTISYIIVSLFCWRWVS